MIKNHERFDGSEDTCPNHGAAIKREYTFGMSDCDVIKYACGCCGVDLHDMDDLVYAKDWATASGIARLHVAIESATDIR